MSILQIQQWFLDYVAEMREVNICHNLLLLTEQSKRIRHGDSIDKIIVLMDLHHGKLEEACIETPRLSVGRLERIAAINATTLQAIAGVIANHRIWLNLLNAHAVLVVPNGGQPPGPVGLRGIHGPHAPPAA